MSEIKKQRKKTPESSNSCPNPRRIDPPLKVQQEKKINKQRTQGAKAPRSWESGLKEWECLGIVTATAPHRLYQKVAVRLRDARSQLRGRRCRLERMVVSRCCSREPAVWRPHSHAPRHGKD